MKAYAYKVDIGISDCVFKVITEQGDLFCESWKYFSTKAKESVLAKYSVLDYDVEWVNYPRTHKGITDALKKYALTNGVQYDCREY